MKYFDYASTTPIDPEILKAYEKTLHTYYANADSLHDMGREVDKLVEKSRAQVAQLLSVREDEILFTSCASESNNLAIKGYAFQYANRGKHLITTAAEHSSVKNTFQQLEQYFGFEVTYLPLCENGQVDVEKLKQALRSDTILVSIMHVNNETGAINPIAEIAALLRSTPFAKLHVDCVQSLGKIKIPTAYIDMATFSAHKIYGLKGSAVLLKKANIKLLPLICGGQQEFGLRGGTNNAPVNILFAKTLRLALERQEAHYAYIKNLKDIVIEELLSMDDVILNSTDDCVPHIINVSFLKVGSEVMQNALNERGFCISAQSTCSSKSKAYSYVLSAMGKDDKIATHAIRISLSHLTSEQDVHALMKAIKEVNDLYGTK